MTRRRVRVIVDMWNPLGVGLTTVAEPLSGREHSLLDMLRYAGKLESNVKDHPRVIEYVTDHDPKTEIARWSGFGFTAVEVPDV